MLQLKSYLRPNCDYIINFLENNFKYENVTESAGKENNNPSTSTPNKNEGENYKIFKSADKKIISTIYIPRKFNEINQVLPKSKYKEINYRYKLK